MVMVSDLFKALGCFAAAGVLLTAVYVGSLAVVLLLVGAVYEFLLRFVG